MIRHTLTTALLASAFAVPVAAQAAGNVALTSEMLVERVVKASDGSAKTVLDAPKSVPPGAKLVFVLSYRNTGAAPANNFVIDNPMPAGVAFESADNGGTVSVDGGRSFGALAAARVRAADGLPRAARPEDVSNVRWAMTAPIPVGGAGRVSFRGTVK